MRIFAALALAPLLLAAGPSTAPELVVDCYVMQSGSGVGQFIRHLRVQPARQVVSVSDGVRGGAPRFLGDGRLLMFDADRLVFDFASAASSGRTEINRRTGAFLYRDGRTVIEGTCQEGGA